MNDSQWDVRNKLSEALRQMPGPLERAPKRLEKILLNLDPEVIDHFSGCGSPIPESIDGCRVLDLGCGTGRDVYLCAALAGPAGFVMGLDTETESLAVARRHVEATMGRFGFTEPNVVFRKGSIMAMRDAGLMEEDFDVVISNRALNLVGDKLKVLREIHRVLKPGGEFYFSDVYCDRRPDSDVGHCADTCEVAVAHYVGDFVRMARKAGFGDPRIVASRQLDAPRAEGCAEAEGARYWALTFRLFKIAGVEDGDEDYGQAALYRGTIEGCAHHFVLDNLYRFEAGKAKRIGGNTARILEQSRFAPHFKILGDFSRHFGPFAKGA